MRGRDVEDYAVSRFLFSLYSIFAVQLINFIQVLVASELRSMRHFRTLHLGTYMTDNSAIWIHRWNHKKYHPIEDRLYYYPPTSVHSNLHLIAMQANEDGPPINTNYPRPADRKLWARHCPECVKAYASPAEILERRVSSLIASAVCSLRTISFASFVSEGRLDSSSWEISRSHRSPPVIDDIEELQGGLGVPFQVGTYRRGDPGHIEWQGSPQMPVVA